MMDAVDTLTLRRPDDCHLHLRDGEAMASVLAHTVRRFARAIVMPNLAPPVTTVDAVRAYRERILGALAAAAGSGIVAAEAEFTPLMTLYLTDDTAGSEIARAAASGFVHGAKLYPAGATTHSDAGVTRIERAFPALEAMQRHELPLLVHGEATAPEVDVYDRERVFLDAGLDPIRRRFPGLRIVLEHVTTREAVQYVSEAGSGVAATITAHHLLFSRNAMFERGLRPHRYCLPVLKRETHRQALVAAAISGDPKFFLGTDSAPHARSAKESGCGCAGIYTADAAIELYAEAFDAAGALDRLEAFAAHHGADFYRLPRNRGTVTLRRERWQAPADYPFGAHRVVPARAGESLAWRLVGGSPGKL